MAFSFKQAQPASPAVTVLSASTPAIWRGAALSVAASALLAGALGAAFIGASAIVPAVAIGLVSPLCCLPLLARQKAEAARQIALVKTSLGGASRMDATTGLLNRAGFADEGSAAFVRARAGGGLISAVVIDVDHLKTINDEHGTECGDMILAHVAKLIRLNIQQKVDLAARNAGAEFVLLLPEADEAWAGAFADRLRGTLANRPVQYNSDLITISASFGIASITEGDADMDGLIRRARKAMQAAKARGCNKVEVAADQLPLAA